MAMSASIEICNSTWLWDLLMAMSANTEICNSMAMDLVMAMSANRENCNSMSMGLADGNVSKHVELQ